MFRRVSSLLALLGVVGCRPVPTPPPVRQSDKLAIKPLIKFYEKAKLGESIDDVSRGLAKCVVYVPTEELHERGKPMKMKTSPDNRGREWLYLYTDEPELLAAFPQGTPYVKMRLRLGLSPDCGGPPLLGPVHQSHPRVPLPDSPRSLRRRPQSPRLRPVVGKDPDQVS